LVIVTYFLIDWQFIKRIPTGIISGGTL